MEFDYGVDIYKSEIIKKIQDFVRIKSTRGYFKKNQPFGRGPLNALNYVLKLGQTFGFKCENFDGYAGHVEYGEGNEIVGILVHVDIVKEGKGWTYPPFGGEIHDGKIFGRGSFDNKGGCIASLYALKVLKDKGLVLNKKVRIIFGCNEESGMQDIPYYLSKNKEPDVAFSPDSPFPVVYGESGILDLVFTKKIKRNQNQGLFNIEHIQGGEMHKKVPGLCSILIDKNQNRELDLMTLLTKYIKTKKVNVESIEKGDKIFVKYNGISCSAIHPENGDNAISGMMDILNFLPLNNGDLKDFITFFEKTIGQTIHGEKIGYNFQDEISSLFTFCPTMINYDGKTLKMHIHIRYPIKTKYEKLIEIIKKITSTCSIEIEVKEHLQPHYIPKNSFLVKNLMSVYKEETGDYNIEPITMAGGTYARTLKNAVGFGALFPGEKQVAHEVDEYLNINSIIKATKIYTRAIYELAR